MTAASQCNQVLCIDVVFSFRSTPDTRASGLHLDAQVLEDRVLTRIRCRRRVVAVAQPKTSPASCFGTARPFPNAEAMLFPALRCLNANLTISSISTGPTTDRYPGQRAKSGDRQRRSISHTCCVVAQCIADFHLKARLCVQGSAHSSSSPLLLLYTSPFRFAASNMRAAFVAIALAASSVSAIQINFVNNCAQREPNPRPRRPREFSTIFFLSAVWAAVGAAPNGVPNPKIAWGQELAAHGGQGGFHVDDSAIVPGSLSQSLLEGLRSV
jgi:hypothetical protein